MDRYLVKYSHTRCNKEFVSGSLEGIVTIHNKYLFPIYELHSKSMNCYALCILQGGDILVTGSGAGHLLVWAVRDHLLLALIFAHTASVISIAYLHTNTIASTAGFGDGTISPLTIYIYIYILGSIKIWDMEGYICKRTIACGNNLNIRLYYYRSLKVLIAGTARSLIFWDIERGVVEETFQTKGKVTVIQALPVCPNSILLDGKGSTIMGQIITNNLTIYSKRKEGVDTQSEYWVPSYDILTPFKGNDRYINTALAMLSRGRVAYGLYATLNLIAIQDIPQFTLQKEYKLIKDNDSFNTIKEVVEDILVITTFYGYSFYFDLSTNKILSQHPQKYECKKLILFRNTMCA